jgi:hypothetical protein
MESKGPFLTGHSCRAAIVGITMYFVKQSDTCAYDIEINESQQGFKHI